MPCNLKDLGWDKVTQIDSHGKTGWAGDLMNDELYTTLKSDVSEGMYDVLFIASPCTTLSMSRFFTLPGNEPGPPVIHNIDYPDVVYLGIRYPPHIIEILRISLSLLWAHHRNSSLSYTFA